MRKTRRYIKDNSLERLFLFYTPSMCTTNNFIRVKQIQRLVSDMIAIDACIIERLTVLSQVLFK